MTVPQIIANEQARVRAAARAVIAQRDADIASYRHPALPPGLPPGTIADHFPPLPPPIPGFDQNEVPVGGTMMPYPGSASSVQILPPVPLGEVFDDWFNAEYDSFSNGTVPETESSVYEDAGRAPQKARGKKRRKKAVKKKAKPKGKKAKPKAKPKAKARRKKTPVKKKKPIPGADSY